MKIFSNKNSPSPENSATRLPRVAVTMGDAAGIGAEVVLKALAGDDVRRFCLPIVIGDAAFLERTARELNLAFDFARIEKNGEIAENSNKILVYDLANLPGEIVPGKESATTGKASAEYIEAAVTLWKDNKIDAVATAPISKKAIQSGGYDYPGHTEFLAHLTGTSEFAMSFFADRLRVVLLSTHVSLVEALSLVKKEKLVELIVFTDKTLSALLGRSVRIAVAGLNPHASEGGMFGSEEASEIVPAIEECRARGIEVFGAYSPDTIFLRAHRGEFDAVVACYHDQATIAVKCLSFGSSVNVTLGLPLVRTSVDHGTAFDIAGKNLADAASMRAAIRLAADLVREKID